MKNSYFLKSILIALFNYFIICTSYAQDCFQGNLIINTQDDIEEFVNEFPNCTVIEGDLRISSVSSAGIAITDLRLLNNLVTVEGDLFINNVPFLFNLDGLENIQTVGEDVFIGGPEIVDISGLNNISDVGRSISFVYLEFTLFTEFGISFQHA